jgi:sec-independent protein translocase protein TatA
MGISIWQLVIVLVIVLLLFGTKRLKNIGGDLGGAIKGFRKAVKEGESETTAQTAKLEEQEQGNVIEGEATREEEKDKS